MKLLTSVTIAALAVVAAGCSQSDPDDVMAPQANALEPADVNAALGPEPASPDANAVGNETAAGNDAEDEATDEAVSDNRDL